MDAKSAVCGLCDLGVGRLSHNVGREETRGRTMPAGRAFERRAHGRREGKRGGAARRGRRGRGRPRGAAGPGRGRGRGRGPGLPRRGGHPPRGPRAQGDKRRARCRERHGDHAQGRPCRHEGRAGGVAPARRRPEEGPLPHRGPGRGPPHACAPPGGRGALRRDRLPADGCLAPGEPGHGRRAGHRRAPRRRADRPRGPPDQDEGGPRAGAAPLPPRHGDLARPGV